MKELYLYTDGGSRGNPGPSAIGMVLKTPKGEILEQEGRQIGEATNNIAEYRALIEGLKLAQKYQPKKLICFMDSSLAVNQINGKFKVKKAHLAQLVFEVQQQLAEFSGIRAEFRHIPREQNTEADNLLNQAFSANHVS